MGGVVTADMMMTVLTLVRFRMVDLVLLEAVMIWDSIIL